MDNISDLKIAALGLSGVAALYLLIRNVYAGPRLDFIPTVGPAGSVASYIGAFRYVFHAKEMFQEGYDNRHLFSCSRRRPVCSLNARTNRADAMRSWSVLVSGKQLIEDIASAREEDLSFHQSTNEVCTYVSASPFNSEEFNSFFKHVILSAADVKRIPITPP